MFVKLTVGILAIALALVPLIFDFLKKGKEARPLWFKILVSIVTALLTVSTIYGINSDNEEAKKSKGQIKTLTNNIDTIKHSLQQYDFTIDSNNKVVPTTNNVFYSKNATGVNYGQVGDVNSYSKTYNQIEKSKSAEVTVAPFGSNQPHAVEIELLQMPTIKKEANGYSLIYYLQTKAKEEALNLSTDFTCIYRVRGGLNATYSPMGATNNNPLLLTYPSPFKFTFEIDNSIQLDTFYAFLRVRYTNTAEKAEAPYKLLVRVSNNGDGKPHQVFLGTKEYQEVVQYITANNLANQN